MQTGGGVRDEAAAAALADAGVARVVIGTAALEDPALVRRLAPRVSRSRSASTHRDGEVAVHGWTEGSGATVLDVRRRFEDAGVDAARRHRDRPRRHAGRPRPRRVCAAVLARTDLAVIASGGVGTLDDLGALGRLEVDGRRLAGVIVGQGALRGPRSRVAEALSVLGRRSRVSVPPGSSPASTSTDGRVVKGVNFVDLRDAGDPVELAARYDAEGADELVFLDITASSRRARHDRRRRRAAPPRRCSSRSPSAAASARSTTPAGCCGPAPTRSSSTPRRSSGPS